MTIRTALLSAICSILCMPSVTHGQATIEGTITGVHGPITGANVRIAGTSRGAATDTSGYYRIENLSEGTRAIVASAIGYRTVRRTVRLDPNDTRTLDINLEETVIQGGEVVVTGTMRETYVKDSPVKVSVVGIDRLNRGRTGSSIMDLIGSVGGLSTQLNCGVCGTNAIRVNGVEGPNTAVLIDGMPVMGALASVYGLNGISPSIIDRVEVIKGPQSTLYGTQALGGVVNIITKNPENTPTFSADVYGKTTGEGSLNLAASPQIGRFKGFVSGNLLRMEHYFDDNGDGFADMPMRSRVALFGKGTLIGDDGKQLLNVAAKLYGENRTGGTAEFTDGMRGSDTIYGESIYTRRSEVMAELLPPGFDQRLRLSGAFTDHDQDSYYGTDNYDARQQIAYGQATWNQKISEAARILAGTTVKYQVYDDNTPATSSGADRRLIPGIFGQSEISIGTVTLLGGLRLDHHAEHGLVNAPRFSVKYSPSDRTTARLSGGTGFRVVNVFTEDHAALTGSRDVVFAEDLDPETSRSMTASIEHIFPLFANPLTLSVDGFYTRFANKIIPDYDQDPNLIVYENLDGFSVTRGFSVGLDQNFTALPLSYDADLTLMDVYTRAKGKREAMTYAPDFTGSLGMTYEIRRIDLAVDYSANIVGPKRMPDNYVEGFGRDQWSPAYSTHNVKVTREFMNVNDPGSIGLEAYLSVENLFDFTQGTPLVDPANPFGDRFDTIYTWGPIVGRTVLAGIRFNLR